MFLTNKLSSLTKANAMVGREEPMAIPAKHFVNQHPIAPPFPEGIEVIYLGMGCFWGAEKLFWTKEGVWTTATGYSGGYTQNPSYEEVCSERTGHAEVVLVAYQTKKIACQALLTLFWEKHDPTQGMGQGNDRGSQYRSVIYTTTKTQLDLAIASRDRYQQALSQQGYAAITTEIKPAASFYYAEAYHQQYLAKQPNGYCSIGGTGVCLR
ncbi:MAG: peptide-methionine (S)-S-oxide reductase MsrA [Endozoicomonas sp. (ex Botrylloides leachii)]|nr:peptide-methionine (S)-S-oxide reductase MsrA [Endozoicomonas sp. (ex Botrylloides leachii)]